MTIGESTSYCWCGPGAADGLELGGVELLEVDPAILPFAGTLWRVLYEELVLPFRARRFDVLYCTADVCPPFSFVPTVVLIQNLNIYDRRWTDDARTRTLYKLVRWGIPRVRKAMFPTRAAADLIQPRLPLDGDRVEVIHYGIDPRFLDPAAAAPHEPRNPPYLFLPATLDRHKNPSQAVEALARTGRADLELWLAGPDGVDPAYVDGLREQVRRLGLERRVRFLGSVDYAQMRGYYREAAALIFPSFIETFGYPLLEAMACGTPVIASDIPTFREIAGDTALYASPEDPDALAAAIDALWDDPQSTEIRRLAAAARAPRFTWKANVDRLCQVLFETAEIR